MAEYMPQDIWKTAASQNKEKINYGAEYNPETFVESSACTILLRFRLESE
jgi:hypothetical protein